MRSVIGLILVGTWLAGSAAAAEAEDGFQPGMYFGLGAVYAFPDFSFDSENLGMTAILGPGVDPDFDDSAGAHLQVGYRAHPMLGVEFLYEFLEGFDSTNGSPDVEIDSHLFVLNAKLYPLAQPWRSLEPYLLAGLGAHLINSEVFDVAVKKPFETDLGFVGRLGGGLAYHVNRHFVMELEGSYQLGEGGIVRYARYGALALHFIYRR
jgi:opacity protein-like surface antigen